MGQGQPPSCGHPPVLVAGLSGFQGNPLLLLIRTKNLIRGLPLDNTPSLNERIALKVPDPAELVNWLYCIYYTALWTNLALKNRWSPGSGIRS
jgi:hypothetical protein